MIMIEALSRLGTALVSGDGTSVEAETVLVKRAGNGETGAFRLLVERYQGDVYRCCLHWLGSTEDAQEVCQDCFIRAWQALPDYEHQGRFRAWLVRIALNLCRDRARSRGAGQARLTVSLDLAQMDLPCTALRPDDASVWRGEMEKLERGLRELPESLRLPLTLCGLEGLSQEECAEVLGLSVRAVEGRVRRGRQMLVAWWDAAAGQ
jgi:RNA polymerase sigma-70 factor (ECF subfamily)